MRSVVWLRAGASTALLLAMAALAPQVHAAPSDLRTPRGPGGIRPVRSLLEVIHPAEPTHVSAADALRAEIELAALDVETE